VTPAVPAIARVWQALHNLASRLETRTLQISIRVLAAEAGLASAGKISQYLRQLQADGQIAYDPTISTVMLITPVIDHAGDRPSQDMAAQRAEPQPSDHTRDRVNQPCMVLDHESLDQEEESCAPPRKTFDRELYDELLKNPLTNLKMAKRIASSPPGPAADFQTDLKRAMQMPSVRFPFWFTVGKWSDGLRVEEVRIETGTSESDRAGRGDRRPRRTAPGRSELQSRQPKRAQPHQRQRFTVDDPAYAVYLEQFADPEPASTSAG